MSNRDIKPEVVLFLSLFVLVVGLVVTKIADYDFWWHINLGKQICKDFSPVVADKFSYTFFGLPQFNGEWLADLALYLSYLIGGFTGVSILKLSLISATIIFLSLAFFVDNDRNKNTLLAIALSIIVVLFALRFRLFVRPYLFSYLFISLTLFVIQKYRSSDNVRWLYLLPFIEILWANCSKGHFFGPVLVAVAIVASLLQGQRKRPLWVLLPILVLVSGLNPEFYRPYEFLTTFLTDQRVTSLVGEHQPLTSGLLWGTSWHYFVGFQILLVGSVAYFVLLRGWRDYFLFSVFVIFAVPPFFMVRMIDFFALMAFLPFGRFCFFVLDKLGVLKRSKALTVYATSAVILGLCFMSVPDNQTYAFGIGAKEKNIPTEALAFLEENNVPGRMFNSYPYGGYVGWATPHRKVYIDGRVNHLFPPEFHQGYFRIVGEPEQWAMAEKEWGFSVAVLTYDNRSRGRHFPVHLATNPGWVPVYWDYKSVVYLKKNKENSGLIKQFGYRVVRPAFNDFSYLKHLNMSMAHEDIVKGLELDISRDPDNQEPRLAKAFYLFEKNSRYYTKQILEELEVTLKLPPDLAIEHSAKGFVLMIMGQRQNALEKAYDALQIDPDDKGAMFLVEKLQ